MTAGTKTSEFILSALAALLGAFVGSGVLPSEHWSIKLAGIALTALATLGYAVSRGMAKVNAPLPLDDVATAHALLNHASVPAGTPKKESTP